MVIKYSCGVNIVVRRFVYFQGFESNNFKGGAKRERKRERERERENGQPGWETLTNCRMANERPHVASARWSMHRDSNYTTEMNECPLPSRGTSGRENFDGMRVEREREERDIIHTHTHTHTHTHRIVAMVLAKSIYRPLFSQRWHVNSIQKTASSLDYCQRIGIT